MEPSAGQAVSPPRMKRLLLIAGACVLLAFGVVGYAVMLRGGNASGLPVPASPLIGVATCDTPVATATSTYKNAWLGFEVAMVPGWIENRYDRLPSFYKCASAKDPIMDAISISGEVYDYHPPEDFELVRAEVEADAKKYGVVADTSVIPGAQVYDITQKYAEYNEKIRTYMAVFPVARRAFRIETDYPINTYPFLATFVPLQPSTESVEDARWMKEVTASNQRFGTLCKQKAAAFPKDAYPLTDGWCEIEHPYDKESAELTKNERAEGDTVENWKPVRIYKENGSIYLDVEYSYHGLTFYDENTPCDPKTYQPELFDTDHRGNKIFYECRSEDGTDQYLFRAFPEHLPITKIKLEPTTKIRLVGNGASAAMDLYTISPEEFLAALPASGNLTRLSFPLDFIFKDGKVLYVHEIWVP